MELRPRSLMIDDGTWKGLQALARQRSKDEGRNVSLSELVRVAIRRLLEVGDPPGRATDGDEASYDRARQAKAEALQRAKEQ